MKTRRRFIRTGLIFVPNALLIERALAQSGLRDPAFVGNLKPAPAGGGGGGCSTSQISFAGAATTSLALDDGSATDYYLATQFVAGSAFTPCSVLATLANAISGATAVAEIWSSTGAGTQPSAKLGNSSDSVNLGTLTGSQAQYTFGNITGVGALTNGSTYHAIIKLVSGGGNFSGNGDFYYQSAASTSVAFAMSVRQGAGAWTDVNGGADSARFKVQINS